MHIFKYMHRTKVNIHLPSDKYRHFYDFFKKILDHPNINIELGIDALEDIKIVEKEIDLTKRVVYNEGSKSND